MDHNEDFSEVATYLRGAVRVFELVQSSRDAMRFLICTGCSQLRVVRVYVVVVGHGGSFTAEVRRVLFDVRIRRCQSSFNLYYHSLGTPVGGQFLMYIRALRATLNKTDYLYNSMSLPIS